MISPGRLSWLAAAVGVLATCVTVLTAIISVYFTYISLKNEDRSFRADRETSDREYMLKVTDKVTQSLDRNDIRQQTVAAAMVATLPDGETRRSLSAVLIEVGLPAVRAQVQRRLKEDEKFKETQRSKPFTSSMQVSKRDNIEKGVLASGDDFTFTIYYCNRIESQKSAAEGWVRSLGMYKTRLIELPASKNLDPDFQKNSNIVYYNSDRDDISMIMNSEFGSEGFGAIKTSSIPRNHADVYVCGTTFEEEQLRLAEETEKLQ